MSTTVLDSRRTFGGRTYELASSDLYFHKTDSDMVHLPSCPHGVTNNFEEWGADETLQAWINAADVPLREAQKPRWCTDCTAVHVRTNAFHDRKKIDAVGAAGREFLVAGLTRGRSVIDPRVEAWNAQTARAFITTMSDEEVIAGIDGFGARLQAQLADQPREVILLAADLLYIHSLPLSNWLLPAKLSRVETALSALRDHADVPDFMMDGLRLGGVFNGGVGFGTQGWRHLLWLARFVERWSEASAVERESALHDPWEFRRFIDKVPEPAAAIQHSIAYLMFSDYFDNVVKSEAKRDIRDTWIKVLAPAEPRGDDTLSIDQDLYDIRRHLEKDLDYRLDWYVEPFNTWQKPKTKSLRSESQKATNPVDSEDEDVDGVTLRKATETFAEGLHFPVGTLDEMIDLLEQRKQIILYGPPGTGKTYVARAIARHLTDPDAVRIVQFHPSYAYEDFFEGFRPALDGNARFVLTPGPLRLIAEAAAANPQTPYVLIIDELNRANLAKVFGELYFLLEYRDEAVGLQYSPGDAFSLPENLFLIGTMNTSDRSIALVDAAIRRRFSFVELHPADAPVRDVLDRWMRATGRTDDRADLLRALNNAMGEDLRDLHIGPSFVMSKQADTESGLQQIWAHDILPLLEEHFFGRLSRGVVHERFGLEGLRSRLQVPEG